MSMLIFVMTCVMLAMVFPVLWAIPILFLGLLIELLPLILLVAILAYIIKVICL